ncbi:MAG: hypothetical protein LBB89_01825 [Treponema sp.]|jgi:hypothetical protein|nr:hypothetical protein [Treponema sp.]
MKTKNQRRINHGEHGGRNVCIFLLLILALTACPTDSGDSTEKPKVKPPATKSLSFGTDCKVTIKSDDKFTTAEWNTLCNKVIAALNAAYTAAPPPSKTQFGNVFGGNGVTIVLVDSLADDKSWEVRVGEFRTLYLKTSSIATAVYGSAVQYMTNSTAGVGKASPAKGGVFLAIQRRTPFLMSDTVTIFGGFYG